MKVPSIFPTKDRAKRFVHIANISVVIYWLTLRRKFVRLYFQEERVLANATVAAMEKRLVAGCH
jgi:hypothetical protein